MESLAKRVNKNFSRIKFRGKTIKVPKLKDKGPKARKQISSDKSRASNSSLVNLMIKAAVERVKEEKQEEKKTETKSYNLREDNEQPILGGYGTTSKTYGAALTASYVSYEKIFSYLGQFRANSSQSESPGQGVSDPLLRDNSFFLIDKETMDKGADHIRYFMPKMTVVDKTSLVPLPGMNSAEWEQFKWFMKLETATYLLKISTA